ncbi:unnamed protein product [Parnassius apollo]|uniref:(apollo) hypothetical protein n=1 Tax=Parnassius apollo TaxID=110799 RepID=A0A8S3X6X1_PARAO|nr:unnamed protein product [Parnassius apollo]
MSLTKLLRQRSQSAPCERCERRASAEFRVQRPVCAYGRPRSNGVGPGRLPLMDAQIMDDGKKIVRKGPLPGGRQGASGAGAGRDSMRAASRARGAARPLSNPPHPSSPPEGLVSAGSSRTQQAAPAAGGARRMRWSKLMNSNALRAYYRAKGEETGCLVYRALSIRHLYPSLSKTWQTEFGTSCAPTYSVTPNSNDYDDVRPIPSSNGNATAGNAAPLDAQQTAYVDVAVNIPFVAEFRR